MCKFQGFWKRLLFDFIQKAGDGFHQYIFKKAKEQKVIGAEQAYGVISTFCYHPIRGVAEYVYYEADAAWLHCVVGHRIENTFPDAVEEMKKYDVIAGKTANDATNVT